MTCGPAPALPNTQGEKMLVNLEDWLQYFKPETLAEMYNDQVELMEEDYLSDSDIEEVKKNLFIIWKMGNLDSPCNAETFLKLTHK